MHSHAPEFPINFGTMNYITNLLGKVLFPNLPRDLRQRRMNVIYIVLLVGVMVAGVVGISIFKMRGVIGH